MRKKPVIKNSIAVLNQETKQMPPEEVKSSKDTRTNNSKQLQTPTPAEHPQNGPKESQIEDMEVEELDLEAIEKAVEDKDGYVRAEQVKLLEEAILQVNSKRSLGIETTPAGENKRKYVEFGEKKGRKTNKQRITEVRTKLIESGKYPTIKAVLTFLRKSNQ